MRQHCCDNPGSESQGPLIPQWQTHLSNETPETRPGNTCAGGRELDPPCFSQSLRFSLTTRISPNSKNSVFYLPGQSSQNVTWESLPGLSSQDSFLYFLVHFQESLVLCVQHFPATTSLLFRNKNNFHSLSLWRSW